jgi:hypothetical protein
MGLLLPAIHIEAPLQEIVAKTCEGRPGAAVVK